MLNVREGVVRSREVQVTYFNTFISKYGEKHCYNHFRHNIGDSVVAGALAYPRVNREGRFYPFVSIYAMYD